MKKNVFRVVSYFLFTYLIIRVRRLKLNVVPHEILGDDDLD